MKIIVLTIFLSLNVNRFICLLIFFLVWCLACNSVSITSLTILKWSFLLPCLIESFTLVKVDIMFSPLHVFLKWISAFIFLNRVFRSSNVRVTIKVSCPCFFLTCLNILEQAYNLIINNNTRSLKIAAGWSKYCFDF